MCVIDESILFTPIPEDEHFTCVHDHAQTTHVNTYIKLIVLYYLLQAYISGRDILRVRTDDRL